MSSLAPTFVREGNHVLAVFEDQVIAKGTDFESVEREADQVLDELESTRATAAAVEAKRTATHIETPNGVKGVILSQHDGQWGERVITARLDNGRIVRLATHAGNDDDIKYSTVGAARAESAFAHLTDLLNEVPEGDRPSLTARIVTLDEVITKAGSVIQTGVPYADERKLNDMVIAAEHEKGEVREALDHLKQADAEAFVPESTYSFGTAEQADLGGGSGSWLDATVDEMVAESEGQDFDALLDEGPGLFATELDTGTLGDAGVTREMALSHIKSKTAGLAGDEIDTYRDQFVAKVELARRDELASRKDTARTAAEQTQDDLTDFPDEALFS